MTRTRALLGCVITFAVLVLADAAFSKEIRTTTCGSNHCRTVTGGLSSIATLPGRVDAPRTGRFYTVSSNVESAGWKVVYERRRQIVRAADLRASSFLGRGWLRLKPEMHPQFARAVRGLEPMRAAPR